MKRSLKTKAICVILSLLLLMQIAPLSTIAVETENATLSNLSEVNEKENIEISCEIVESRTEYSKVFLLSDDTFYNINTTYPLHLWDSSNGWTNIYNDFDNANTIDDVKTIVNSINISSTSANTVQLTSETTGSSSYAEIVPVFNSGICWATEYEAYEIEAGDGALRITPNSIVPFTARNKVINSAYLTFNRAEIDNPVSSEITIYEGIEEVTATNIDELRVVDKFTATDIAEYNIDITNLYAKWDLDVEEKLGIVLRAKGTDFFTIRNAYFEVFFEEVDWNDTDYTYRTVDLGDGGTLSINNYTNTVLLENRLFKLDSTVLPVYISRINDGANPNVSSSAGFGFTWNIESTISISNDLGVWNTIDLEKKRFVPDDTVVIENGYQVWRENGSNGIEDQTSIYFYVPNDEVENNSIDYSHVYIKQGDTKYSFDAEGRLVSVERPGLNNIILTVSIVYDEEGNLDYILDENGKNYNFNYSYNPNLRKRFLSQVWIDGSHSILFGTETHTESIHELFPDYVYNRVSYLDDGEVIEGETIYYYVEKMGNVVSISDLEDNLWDFYYCNYGDRTRNLGNRLESYRIHPKKSENENYYSPKWLMTFDTPNANYREITETNLITEEASSEIIQYDRNHRIITHKEPNGYCICVEYGEDDIINSFAFNEKENNMILNPGFEVDEDNAEYGWSNSEYTTLVPSTFENGEHGTYELKLSIPNELNISVSQTVTGSFLADKTYVVGSWIKVDNTIPTEERKIGVQVLDMSNQNNISEVAFGTIDNGLDGEWQYRLQAFKLSKKCTKLQINLTAINQSGEIRFDDITLFEADESRADLKDIETSSPVSYTYNDGNLVTNETITNGIHSIKKTYEYYNDGKISKITDINGKDTFYNYTADGVSSTGTAIDANGNIVDATNFEYDALGKLNQISQTVSVLNSNNSLNDNLEMTTQFGWTDNNISSVTHNGTMYSFEYENGALMSVNISTNKDETSNSYLSTNNIISYIYDDYDGSLSAITYSNGTTILYGYNERGEVIYAGYCDSENLDIPLYSYVYNYEGDSLESISYFVSEDEYYTVIYGDNDGYTINMLGNELYDKTIYGSSEIVETINQEYWIEENNTTSDIITTSANTISNANSSNGEITESSQIVVNKNANNNRYSEITYDRSSVTDYFGRIIKKSTEIEYDTGDATGTEYNITSDTDYEYLLLDVGVTSGLVSKYTNTISGGTQGNVYKSYSRYYEYDNKGNIKYVYMLNGTTETPTEFYEYDEANQLVTSVDFLENSVIGYIYDAGGNIVEKNTYNYSNLEFDCSNRKIISKGDVVSSVSYEYDSLQKDLLISYNEGTTINYDSLGNPLNYSGRSVIENSNISGALSWTGNLLNSFENEDIKIEYHYNRNGYRTQKIVFDKELDRIKYKMTYIWDNNVLTNLIYQAYGCEANNINIIYDQEGSPVGMISAFGIPYYYVKDINDNVIGLITSDGSDVWSISYDNWGVPTFEYESGLSVILESTMAVSLNPITYHGYIYDYETGLYCSREKIYSPEWGRYLNPDMPTELFNSTENILDSNLYLFCNNNPINNIDSNALISLDRFNLPLKMRIGSIRFTIASNELFSSRAFCVLFANQLIKKYGTGSTTTGYKYLGMDSSQIAATLFANYVARNAPAAINKVNAYWGDAWILSCQNSSDITVKANDSNLWKYEKIWYAAPKIKEYAWSEGVYITI